MDKNEMIGILKDRFGKNEKRHAGIRWEDVETALDRSEKLQILMNMEETGGEPDVVKAEDGVYWFFDCSKESPAGRRSICYDEAARKARKANPPESSAEKLAQEIGSEILNEEDYLFLQSLGDFDNKSQCWIGTDPDFRGKGDALFANARHGRTFFFYNGADAYYRIRGFRSKVLI